MAEKRKRRWYQFSLRALLVLVVLVSIGVSWLAVKLERARRQQIAVERLRKLGAAVFYVNPLVVGSVDLRGLQVGDAGLEHLKGVTSLIGLYLSNTQVGDAGLEHLKGLTSLYMLDLSDTQISDAGLEHLDGLTNLTQLNLSYTRITDAGLERVERLANLHWLDLRGTRVTHEGVKKLQEALPECEIVY